MKPLLSDYARRARLKAILPFVRGDVLDLGCGWMHLPDYLATHQAYVGVDVSPAAVKYNTQCYPGHTFYQCDLDTEPLNLKGRRFHSVTMVAVLEHLHSPEGILRQVHSALTPDGLLLITTPSPLGDGVHRVGSRLGLFYSESRVRHIKIYSPGQLRELVVECGYDVRRARIFLAGTNQLLVCRSADRAGSGGQEKGAGLCVSF
jgi:2-polyprenyl-3-methyl-5-hydroxy-6-metoxy-1,4-benzoquinol methylase